MAEFKTCQLHCYDYRYLTVSWDMAGIPTGPVITFDLYRSESPEGDFELIKKNIPSSRAHYHDWEANTKNKWRTIYYKIVYKEDGVDTVTSDPIRIENALDAEALDIVRRQNLVLWYKSGRPGFFLIERSWGPRCTRCYNPASGRTMDPDCPECFGTKYSGGYFEPIFGYIAQSGLGSRKTQITSLIEIQQGSRQFWTSNYPLLKPRDIFVDNMNRRWRIKQTYLTEKLGAYMRQILSAEELPKNHKIYDVVVPNLYNFVPIRDYHVWDGQDIQLP